MFSAIIKILLLVTCVQKVDGASSKHRLNTLELRMNSIEVRVNTDNSMTRVALTSMEKDIETLNASFTRLECRKGEVEERLKVQQVSDQSDVSRISKYLITKGLADEKKWLREKVSYIENEMQEKKNQVDYSLSKIESQLKSKFESMKNDLVNNLNEMGNIIYDKMQELEINVSAVMTEVKASENMLEKLDGENANQKLERETLKRKLQKGRVVVCEDGWTQFESFCYLYVDQKKTLFSAREACRKLGASIADIQSQTEYEFVYNLCEINGHEWTTGSSDTLWIGITDETTEGVWISDRTGASVTYTNWDSTQPEGGSIQNCALIGWASPFDKWFDRPCTSGANFVCKK